MAIVRQRKSRGFPRLFRYGMVVQVDRSDLHRLGHYGSVVFHHLLDAFADSQALEGFDLLSRLEGIQPALESSHAVAYGYALARRMRKSETVLVNLSGRGDKDLGILMEQEGLIK